MIISTFNKIKNLGVNETLNIVDIKKIRISNITYAFTAIINISYASVHIALKTAVFAPILDIFCFLLSALSLYLNHQKKYYESRIFNVSTSILQIVMLCILFGHYPGNEYFLIPVFYVVIYFFKSKKTIYSFSVLIAISFILLKYYFIKYDAIYPMPEVSIYYFPTLIVAFIMVFIFTQFVKSDELYFQKQLEKQKQIVEAKNNLLNVQNEEIAAQRDEIEAQRDLVINQKEHIEKIYKDVSDSINYAERIQRSFLATDELLNQNLKEYFIFFKPKDVVSGDFYWANKLSNGNFILVTADSTGHGVPGAIMSILNITSLEKAIEQDLCNPSEILNHTRKTIIERLKKDGSANGGKDGMDASLICFDFAHQKFTYAAANNPIWIVRENALIELSPDKMPVGKHDKDQQLFSQHEFQLQKGDVIYTFTDGMADQFGGEKERKFLTKNLKNLLITNSPQPMVNQQQTLETTLTTWIGNGEQIDDITIIGIRI